MSDNVPITAGSGTSVATDDVAGNHYQWVKLADGTADSATGIVAGNGAASGALRVTVANDSTGIVGLTGDALTSLQLLDDLVQTEDAAHSSGHKGIMPLAVRNDTGSVLGGSHLDYIPLSADHTGRLRTQTNFDVGVVDSFGHVVTAGIRNQIDIQFYRSADPDTLVTVTETNSGTATSSGGMATFAAAAQANSVAKGVSSGTFTFSTEDILDFVGVFPFEIYVDDGVFQYIAARGKLSSVADMV